MLKEKHLPPKEELTELLAAKIASRIIVRKGGLFLTGEGGGKLSVLAQGDPGEPGKTPVKGVDYFDGKDAKGRKGDVISFQWDGTRLRFQNSDSRDSSWGQWVDLKGEPGKKGKAPVKGVDYEDGTPGKTPVKGKDYFDGTPGKTPVKGVDYFDGKNGKTPKKGVDYKDGKDGKTPVKGKDYCDGKTPVKGVDYEDGKPGKTPVKGVDYEDGAPGDPGIAPAEVLFMTNKLVELQKRIAKLERRA